MLSRPWLIFIGVIVLLVVIACFYYGCVGRSKKEDEVAAIPPPPPRGQASSDELTTVLGQARALDEGLAPTSVKWTRVIPIDDKRLILAGEVVNETVAIVTADGGNTWRSFRAERDAWSNWSIGMDGALVLGVGSREGAPTAQSAMLEPTKLFFAALDADALTAPTPLFPTAKGPVKGILQTDSAVPALLAAGSAALIAEESPKKWFVFYGGKPGSDAVAPLKLPGSEKISPMPYARPPFMLSLKGKDLLFRAFPPAGKPLDKPQKIAGVTTGNTLLAEISAQPACESHEWSFQRITQGKRLAVLGISAARQVTYLLPENTAPGTRIGCGRDGLLAIEAIQPKTGAPATWAQQPDLPTILSCDLAGKCSTPKNAPFRVWPEQHKREIFMQTTDDSVLGVMSLRSGTRWGLYLAQGPKDGTTWERPRPIGEGTGDRGRIELGALVSFGKRALLLISADVTGTSRRGWFVMVSDDGGTNWNPP